MASWVSLTDFASELTGFKAEVSVRQMAQRGALEAEKRGRAWYVNATSSSAVDLLEQARQWREERERQNREKAEAWRIRDLAEHAAGRIAELENTIAERNATIDELKSVIDTQAKRIASLETSLEVQTARVDTFREILGAKHPTTPKTASKAPSKPSEGLVAAWEEARRENPRVTLREVSGRLGVSEEVLRKAVRRERDRRRRETKKKTEGK